jgi:hypothetical protein
MVYSFYIRIDFIAAKILLGATGLPVLTKINAPDDQSHMIY